MDDSKEKQAALLQALTESEGDQVALKGILRNGKSTQALHSLPMNTFSYPEFQVQGRLSKPKPEIQKRIQAMEQEIAKLHQQLERVSSEQQRALEVARKKALAEGFERGQKENETKVTETLQNQVSQLQKELEATLQSIRQNYDDRVQEIQGQCVELALGLARKLFCVEAETNPQHIAHLVEEAFTHLGQAESVVLHLHPLDISTAEETRSFWHPINSSLRSVRLEPDSRIEKGGCWLESDGGGSVDLRTSVILTRLEEMVRTAIRNSSPSNSEEA
ncbi:MAG TPA: FliH/SctL family protein [Fibrobacteraceae bacterium]|nr:FliH/SctL family protein [Fibrobacteraceae bacterium]